MSAQPKRWRVFGSSGANATDEVAKAAPSDDKRQLLVTGYLAIVRAAVTGADVAIQIETAGDVVLHPDYFGSAAARGTRIGINEGFEGAIEIPVGEGCKITAEAGGTGCIITTVMWGIEI